MNHALKPPCPICGNNERTRMHTVEPCGKVFRVQCEDCKTIYFDRTPPYEPKYDLAYNKHFFRPGDIRKAGIMAAHIAEIANSRYFGACVLEAGTGNGLTAFLLNEMNVYTEAVDMDTDLASFLRQRYDLKVNVSKFEDWKTDTTWALIYSSHVIEHSADPQAFLRKALSLLTPGGLLILETPDVRYCAPVVKRWHHFATRDPYEHRHLFAQSGMYLLLSRLGYVNIRIETIPEYQIMRIQAEKAK